MSDVKIFAERDENFAGVEEQVNSIVNHPAFADAKIRIMSDCHVGKGCVIGFTANLGEKVVPNLIGVDLNCGMLTIPIGTNDIDWKKLSKVIDRRVPHGMNIHSTSQMSVNEIKDLTCFRNLTKIDCLLRSLGTLGGGNHFIEVDEASDGMKYLIIHTGSRNLGKQIATHHQGVAVELAKGREELESNIKATIELYKAQGRHTEISGVITQMRRDFDNSELNIDKDLAYLTGIHREDYLHDVDIAASFAHNNRYRIAENILDGMNFEIVGTPFETVHNYLGDDGIIRKGAISANLGEKVLIPLNMRDGSLICVGKGNEDWNNSAPHGAGRKMSRSKAREELDFASYYKMMKDSGINTTSVCEETLDEAPMAYKDPKNILKFIGDTVDIIDTIKPTYNFKSC